MHEYLEKTEPLPPPPQQPEKKPLSMYRKINVGYNLVMTLFYIVYVVVLFTTGRGNKLVNCFLLAFTVLYAFFFALGMVWTLFNRSNSKLFRIGIRSYKTLRHIMLLINAFIVGGSIVNVSVRRGFLMWFGLIVSVSSLAVYILFVVFTAAIKRRVRSKLDEWGFLPRKED